MARVSASVEVPHPIDHVFATATRIADLPRWMPEVVHAELLDPELVIGSRVLLRLSPATGNAEITGTVRELVAPTLLRIEGSGGPLTVGVRTVLTATGPSATTAELEIDIVTPAFLGFIATEAARRIDAELPASLARLRALLEADGG
ncbi:MAG: SRPBCC family protein [Chloroflexota bacterium]